jgi:hypothetical protein
MTVLVTGLLSIALGATGVNGPQGAIAGTMLAMGGGAGIAAGLVKGTNAIVTGILDQAIAEGEKVVAINAAKNKQFEAESKYYGSILKHFQEALKGVWEYIEKMFQTQSDLIRTLGDGSTAITRNIAM